jgi:hypothetical protein
MCILHYTVKRLNVLSRKIYSSLLHPVPIESSTWFMVLACMQVLFYRPSVFIYAPMTLVLSVRYAGRENEPLAKLGEGLTDDITI